MMVTKKENSLSKYFSSSELTSDIYFIYHVIYQITPFNDCSSQSDNLPHCLLVGLPVYPLVTVFVSVYLLIIDTLLCHCSEQLRRSRTDSFAAESTSNGMLSPQSISYPISPINSPSSYDPCDQSDDCVSTVDSEMSQPALNAGVATLRPMAAVLPQPQVHRHCFSLIFSFYCNNSKCFFLSIPGPSVLGHYAK